eukprot:1161147-Pelagomonas_calceolata.AAC.10
MSFTTLPDSGCGYALSELNRLLDAPIPRSAISVKSMPHFLSTTSLFYTSMSPTGCPVLTPFTMLAVRRLD